MSYLLSMLKNIRVGSESTVQYEYLWSKNKNKHQNHVGLLAPFLPIKLLWICGMTPMEKKELRNLFTEYFGKIFTTCITFCQLNDRGAKINIHTVGNIERYYILCTL